MPPVGVGRAGHLVLQQCRVVCRLFLSLPPAAGEREEVRCQIAAAEHRIDRTGQQPKPPVAPAILERFDIQIERHPFPQQPLGQLLGDPIDIDLTRVVTESEEELPTRVGLQFFASSSRSLLEILLSR